MAIFPSPLIYSMEMFANEKNNQRSGGLNSINPLGRKAWKSLMMPEAHMLKGLQMILINMDHSDYVTGTHRKTLPTF